MIQNKAGAADRREAATRHYGVDQDRALKMFQMSMGYDDGVARKWQATDDK